MNVQYQSHTGSMTDCLRLIKRFFIVLITLYNSNINFTLIKGILEWNREKLIVKVATDSDTDWQFYT